MRPPLLMRGRLGLATATLAALAAGFALTPAPALAVFTNGKLQVIHLDAGQGDAAVIITPGGQVAMIDDGTNFTAGTSPPSCSRVLAELQARVVPIYDLAWRGHPPSPRSGRSLKTDIPRGGVLDVSAAIPLKLERFNGPAPPSFRPPEA